MRQIKYLGEDQTERSAYEFAYDEFDSLAEALELYGHVAKNALIKSNDPRVGMRPRLRPYNGAYDLLTDVLGGEETNGLVTEPTDLDVLRQEQADLASVTRGNESKIHRPKGTVLLGLYTTALAFNELRPHIMGSNNFNPVQELMQQFHSEGVERLMGKV